MARNQKAPAAPAAPPAPAPPAPPAPESPPTEYPAAYRALAVLKTLLGKEALAVSVRIDAAEAILQAKMDAEASALAREVLLDIAEFKTVGEKRDQVRAAAVLLKNV